MMVDVGVLLSANRYNSWLQSRRKENLIRVRVTNSREKTSMLSVIAVGLCKLNDNVVKVMLNFRPSHPTTLKYFYTQHRFSYLIHIPIHNNYNSIQNTLWFSMTNHWWPSHIVTSTRDSPTWRLLSFAESWQSWSISISGKVALESGCAE